MRAGGRGTWWKAALIFAAGVVAGGYLFADTQPRSFLAVNRCTSSCWKMNDLLGLLGSVGLQRFSALIPGIVEQTERTVVIRHPTPENRTHFVIIPKRDIRDVANLAPEDVAYLADAYAVIGRLVREHHLRHYTVFTYGPGFQDVTYLHFHLVSSEPS